MLPARFEASKRDAADLRLRPHSHFDRPSSYGKKCSRIQHVDKICGDRWLKVAYYDEELAGRRAYLKKMLKNDELYVG